MKNKIQKISLILISILLFTSTKVNIVLANTMVLTTTLESSKLVTGLKNLFVDATKALKIISPLLTALLAGFLFFKMQSAEDEGEVKQIKKSIKTTIISGALVFLAASLVGIILGYFK